MGTPNIRWHTALSKKLDVPHVRLIGYAFVYPIHRWVAVRPQERTRFVKRFIAAIVVLVAGFAMVAPAEAATSHGTQAGYGSGYTPRYYTYTPRYRYSSDATAAIAAASARWGVSYGWLLRVASCESGLNPSAYNSSGASGLFQFMPGTFWLYAAQIGEGRSYWNAYASANVAAYMFSRGLAYEWSCN